jgi:hypothetical protein
MDGEEMFMDASITRERVTKILNKVSLSLS